MCLYRYGWGTSSQAIDASSTGTCCTNYACYFGIYSSFPLFSRAAEKYHVDAREYHQGKLSLNEGEQLCIEVFMNYVAKAIVIRERLMSKNPLKNTELRQRVLNSTPEIFVERAEIITDSYRNNHGKPAIIRRAMALRDILVNLTIDIAPHELIVGNFTKKPRGCQVFPEYDMGFIIQELDEFEYRKADRFIIEEENKNKLRQVFEYWKYNFMLIMLYILNQEQANCMSDLVFTSLLLRSGIGHVIVDYQICLEQVSRNTQIS